MSSLVDEKSGEILVDLKDLEVSIAVVHSVHLVHSVVIHGFFETGISSAPQHGAEP